MIASVYRIYDEHGDLLYVGMTTTPVPDRLTAHRSTAPWWSRLDHWVSESFATKDEAALAERRAIQAEQPEFNVYWNKSRDVHALRRLREERLLTAVELGELVGATSRSVHNWESGVGSPRLSTAIRIAEALDVSLSEIADCFPLEPVSS